MPNPLLTIDDLAARWGVSPRRAREIAGAPDGPPRIDLGPPRKYVAWSGARFAPEDVVAWEEGRKRAGPAAAPAPVAVKVRPTGPRPSVPNRLGRW